MPRPGDDATLREHFAWTYGRLAMAHKAVVDGENRYNRLHYWIGRNFRHKYLAGTMKMRPLHDDERTKMQHGTTCCYCGRDAKLSLDHLIPRLRGGPDAADNITYACRSCNSSKGAKDMVLWLVEKGGFPAVLVMRRYLKLTARWCETHNVMSARWIDADDDELPFDKRALRVNWPHPENLRLWPEPSTD